MRLCALLLALTTSGQFSFAQTPMVSSAEWVHDSGMWGFVLLRARIRPGLQGLLEVSQFIGEDFTQLRAVVIRPALVFSITPQLVGSVGYIAAVRWNATGFDSVEHRTWEQIQGMFDLGPVVLIPRVRFEQRIRDADSSQVAHRLRTMLRAQIPVLRDLSNQAVVNVVVFDEVLTNLGSVSGWTENGLDQNRIFVGANVRLAEGVQLESGYLNMFINAQAGAPDRMNHIWLINLAIDL